MGHPAGADSHATADEDVGATKGLELFCGELTQDVLQDSAVLVVLDLLRCVDANSRIETRFTFTRSLLSALRRRAMCGRRRSHCRAAR